MGEFDHRVTEINEIKRSIVKFLHLNAGFEVVLFESGIGEIISADMNRDIMTPDQLTYGLIGYWRNETYSDLMEFVKNNETLRVAGFDVQRSGRSFGQYLKELNESYRIPPEYNDLEDRFTEMLSDIKKKELTKDFENEVNDLIASYRELYKLWLESPMQSQQEKIAQQTIKNRSFYLEYFLEFRKSNDFEKRWNARDKMMADNILFLIQEVFPNKKVIVNGHNFHIAKSNLNLEVMGELLNKEMGDEMISIGIFSGQGEMGFNDKIKQLSPPDTENLDIKDIISKSPYDYSYLDLDNIEGHPWTKEMIIVNDSFIDLSNSNKLILADHFDGLIFTKWASPVNSNY